MKSLALILILAGCTGALDPDITSGSPGPVNAESTDSDVGEDGPSNGECNAPTGSSRAWGVSAELVGGFVNVSPFPDTADGAHALLGVSATLCTTCATLSISDAVFSVHADSTSTDTTIVEAASAVTNDLRIAIPGLDLRATTLIAVATATADGPFADVSADGSAVLGLTINGDRYVDLDQPWSITITDPITCTPIAEIHVLEVVEDMDGDDASIYVNALRVRLLDLALTPFINEATEIVVAHAEARVQVGRCHPPQPQ